MSKHHTDSAFPELYSDRDGDIQSSPGLTIREHYAGLAMQALLDGGSIDKSLAEYIAKKAVVAADALIAELQK